MIHRVSGRSVQVLSGGRPKNAIYFQLTADLSKGGGFTIHRERTRVFIRSGDPAGWSNALYTIEKEMLGARYYWAGDLGLEFVKPSLTHFPNRPWRETPTFVQRKFYPVNTDFARRNRLNQVYSFNHNLAKVFSEEVFATKPEVFSKVNGRRKVPRGKLQLVISRIIQIARAFLSRSMTTYSSIRLSVLRLPSHRCAIFALVPTILIWFLVL